MHLIAAVVLFLTTLVQIDGFAQYVPLVPNGNRVRNPCAGGGIWAAIGHNAITGGGPRNSFGLDFVFNNYLWTNALCVADSDGDGVPNGVELGDPNCQWTAGSNRRLRAPRGHPGVCEPLGSPRCANISSGCRADGLGVDAVTSQEQASQEQGNATNGQFIAQTNNGYYGNGN